jgi:pimeloyl-ACP methyl ester carboxylesterase
MAVYLRSISLNGILQLPRPYPERPLQVSLADIGSPTGIPVLFFLGIGCVRHLIALFDDLAKALNLRLICIDRWGLGRTTNVPQDKRSPLDWAGVVERVLDEINVDSVRLISHSAGAPYAAATALRLGERVKGKIHFLAPWINVDVDGGR